MRDQANGDLLLDSGPSVVHEVLPRDVQPLTDEEEDGQRDQKGRRVRERPTSASVHGSTDRVREATHGYWYLGIQPGACRHEQRGTDEREPRAQRDQLPD